MVFDATHLAGVENESDWAKNRKLVQRGFGGLAYLPKGRAGWNATLGAIAFSARRRIGGSADLNLWAVMHGLPAGRRQAELGQDALVLWHGTSAARAEKIRRHGLIHKRGVWAATEPAIAHGFTRGRSRAFGAGSAMIVFVVSRRRWEGKATAESATIARFHASIPSECIQYILYADRAEFVGEGKLSTPKAWGAARFKRQDGRWLPRSRPPVRFDAERAYAGLDDWLDLSIGRIFDTLGPAAAVEVFASLYATLDPWAALEHEHIFTALDRLGYAKRTAPGNFGVLEPKGE